MVAFIGEIEGLLGKFLKTGRQQKKLANERLERVSDRKKGYRIRGVEFEERGQT